ncbi:MAG: hypothetical protein U0172_04475 [Nitrospiraceae bacterium]
MAREREYITEQMRDLQRTVQDLRSHVRSLEARLAGASESGRDKLNWWTLLFRRGGGSGRRGTGTLPVRQNRRREQQPSCDLSRLHCA